MKISLNDPIWGRLYGPYGLEPVAEILTSLSDKWDEDIARDLFWEKLHHQETLYPATYAALPWLWDIAKAHKPARMETAGFLSWVIYCALDQVEARSAFGDAFPVRSNGLELATKAHAHPWLPKDCLLTDDDVEVLKALENWFADHLDELADFAVETSKESDPQLIGFFLQGKAAARDAFHLARVVQACGGSGDIFACPHCGAQCWAVWEGESPTFRRYDGPMPEPVPVPPIRLDVTQDKAVALELADRMPSNQSRARAFLLAYAAWESCLP